MKLHYRTLPQLNEADWTKAAPRENTCKTESQTQSYY
jgi:hypothetical protein